MTRMMHLCLSLLLSLAMAGIGVTADAGHAGPTPGQIELVICSDDGAKTITLDAAGNVVDPTDCARHDCPTCLQPVVATLPHGMVQPRPIASRGETCFPQPERSFLRPVAIATARGPPSEV